MVSLKQIYTTIGLVLAIVILGLFATTSWYTVDESEQAVVLTFGDAGDPITEPGLKFKLPWPIQTVEKLSKETFSLDLRFSPGEDGASAAEETKMITGDENIVIADVVVQWRITDPVKFLYNIDNPEQALYNATSASLRSIIGNSQIDEALTDGRAEIEANVRDLLTRLVEEYDMGISIMNVKLRNVDLPNDEVREAFTRVTDARETMNTKINEANKYRNQKINEAQGEKEAIIRRAEGQKEARIQQAHGDVAVFNSLYNAYQNNREVTRERLIIETLEQVLKDAQIYIMDDDGDTVKYFPIPPLTNRAPSSQVIPEGEGSEQNE